MMNDHTQPHPNQPALPRRMTYLLRLWPADETTRIGWRASLESPASGSRLAFASLEQLFVYLLDLCEGRPAPMENDRQTPISGE